MSERDEVKGARNAAAEIVCVYSEVASTAQRSNSPA